MIDCLGVVGNQSILNDLVKGIMAQLRVNQVHLILELLRAFHVNSEDVILYNLYYLSVLPSNPLLF